VRGPCELVVSRLRGITLPPEVERAHGILQAQSGRDSTATGAQLEAFVMTVL
jgi:hypothetical protein